MSIMVRTFYCLLIVHTQHNTATYFVLLVSTFVSCVFILLTDGTTGSLLVQWVICSRVWYSTVRTRTYLTSSTLENYYLRVQNSSNIQECRTGHTSNAQINSLTEPAIQCSLSLSRVNFSFLPLVHIPTYLVQLVHTSMYDSSLLNDFFIPMHLLVNNYCGVLAVQALLLYEAQNHSLFIFWQVSNSKQSLLYSK